VGSGPPASAPAGSLELAIEATEVGTRFDTTVRPGEPTGSVAQSKLWFHDGLWWAAMIADGTDEFRIHRLDWSSAQWLDTGVAIAARSSVLPDVVADGDQLWVAIGGGDPRPQRIASLFRYTYDPEHARYLLDSDFPVTIAEEQAPSLTLARDGQGRLWAAWIDAGRLVVSHTVGNDLTWGDPYVPPLPDLGVAADAAAIMSFDDTVALLWTHQDRDAVYLAVPTSDDIEHWDHHEVAVDGLRHADDQLSAVVEPTVDGPRLYVAVKTSLDAVPNANRDDPQVLLLVREPDGAWEQYLVGRVRDRHTRPIVQLDAENRVIYVIATSSFGGGQIFYKAASADAISFASGLGTLLIGDPSVPAVTSASGTKQPLGSQSGLVVLASDASVGRYVHVAANLRGTSEPALTAPAVEPAPAWLLNDAFDPYPPGTALGGRWATRSTGSAALSVEETPEGRVVASATSTGDGSQVRGCKDITPVSSGVLRVEMDVLVPRATGSDATVTMIRHEGVASVAVRLGDRGVFEYADGPRNVRSQVPYAAGTWYRSVVTVDLETRLYDWDVRRLADDVRVFALSGAAWRVQPEGPITSVCFESPESSAAGLDFAVDRVRVSR
jgi:hypothetical protein